MSQKTKLKTELEFLMALEEGRVITQMTLSKRIGVAVGLINALLKRAMRKGFVKAQAAPYKRYAYYLTPTGFSEKSRLLAEYLESSLSFFRAAQQEYADLLMRAHIRGMRRLALIGGGELVDIAINAARELDIDVVAIFDQETSKERLYRLAVARRIEEIPPVDGVAITDSRAPQIAFELVRNRFEDSQILAPSFLRITRAPLDFKPKLERK
jgi:hypothetical protein